MRKFFPAIVLMLTLALPLGAGESSRSASCLPLHSLSPKKLAFQAGESLDFVFHYNWGIINADVARGSFTADSSRLKKKDVFLVRMFGRTAKFYDAFFKVREDFHSWFTCDGLVPMRFTRDTREGGYYCLNEYAFVHGANPHIAATIENSNLPQKSMEIPLGDCTFDPLTLLYLARNVDMSKVKPDVKIPMTFAIDDEVFNIYFVFKGKDTCKLPGIGTVNTLKFAIKVVAGEMFGDASEDLFMWFSDDEGKVPVYLEAPLKIGKVTGRLEKYSGLKYPLNLK